MQQKKRPEAVGTPDGGGFTLDLRKDSSDHLTSPPAITTHTGSRDTTLPTPASLFSAQGDHLRATVPLKFSDSSCSSGAARYRRKTERETLETDRLGFESQPHPLFKIDFIAENEDQTGSVGHA